MNFAEVCRNHRLRTYTKSDGSLAARNRRGNVELAPWNGQIALYLCAVSGPPRIGTLEKKARGVLGLVEPILEGDWELILPVRSDQVEKLARVFKIVKRPGNRLVSGRTTTGQFMTEAQRQDMRDAGRGHQI